MDLTSVVFAWTTTDSTPKVDGVPPLIVVGAGAGEKPEKDRCQNDYSFARRGDFYAGTRSLPSPKLKVGTYPLTMSVTEEPLPSPGSPAGGRPSAIKESDDIKGRIYRVTWNGGSADGTAGVTACPSSG